MRSGPLRQRVTIQSVTEARDASGGVTETWGTFATRWASVEPVSGKEGFSSDTRFGEITHRVRMRYLAGITPKLRLLLGSRVLDIKSVLNLEERNRELEILAAERV